MSTGRESNEHPLDHFWRELVARRRLSSFSGVAVAHATGNKTSTPSMQLSPPQNCEPDVKLSVSVGVQHDAAHRVADLGAVSVSDASTATDLVQDITCDSKAVSKGVLSSLLGLSRASYRAAETLGVDSLLSQEPAMQNG